MLCHSCRQTLAQVLRASAGVLASCESTADEREVAADEARKALASLVRPSPRPTEGSCR
jgi:hypothetical protein